ncbi:hypothetical protein [Streptomyces sp. NPDC055632]
MICALFATYLGLTEKMAAAAVIGAVAVGAFTAFGGITVTIQIRK